MISSASHQHGTCHGKSLRLGRLITTLCRPLCRWGGAKWQLGRMTVGWKKLGNMFAWLPSITLCRIQFGRQVGGRVHALRDVTPAENSVKVIRLERQTTGQQCAIWRCSALEPAPTPACASWCFLVHWCILGLAALRLCRGPCPSCAHLITRTMPAIQSSCRPYSSASSPLAPHHSQGRSAPRCGTSALLGGEQGRRRAGWRPLWGCPLWSGLLQGACCRPSCRMHIEQGAGAVAVAGSAPECGSRARAGMRPLCPAAGSPAVQGGGLEHCPGHQQHPRHQEGCGKEQKAAQAQHRDVELVADLGQVQQRV